MAEALSQRVMQLLATGQVPQAIGSLRTHLKFKPRDAEALDLLAMVLMRTGDLSGALAACERAVQAVPDAAGLRHNLALILRDSGRLRDAIGQWERAIKLDPVLVPAWVSVATAYLFEGRLSDGLAAARRSVELAPDDVDAMNTLASALQHNGLMAESLAAGEAATRRFPTSTLSHSILLMGSEYVPQASEVIAARLQAFTRSLPAPGPVVIEAPDVGRALRIGVLSPDLREHSVACFASAALMAPRGTDHVVAVSTGPSLSGDAVQARLRSMCDEWHEAMHLPDATLSELLRSLRLDVLVDLAGHSAGNRLAALASKPAPVMITAIGYPNTTGLPAMDWRVVDSITDPPGSEHLCTERLLRLDPCFLCYTPPADAPEPAMPPASVPFTFGSFNNANKISLQTAELWGTLMRAVPDARLLLKARSLGDASVRETILARLEAGGVPRERVDVVSYTSGREAHLALYGRVHVAVDTVPYNGTTTTCEALWMGVPVITTLGDRHAARVSASLLTAAGHPEWIARDADDFARRAAAMAADRPGLTTLRASLRNQVAASTLCDAAAYGRRFHQAIRACWIQACGAATGG